MEGLTFDDVLLIPAESSVIPKDVDVTVRLTPDIVLNIPMLSSAMDTVTEADTAIAIAREGGIGFIHRNNTADAQATEVDRVKKSESGMISDPITVDPDQRVVEALDVMKKYRISGLPVTREGKLVGILTNRDLRFETNFEQPIRSVMTKDDLVTVPVGTTLEQAREILHRNRIEKLLVVDGRNNLKGLITIKDILKITKYPTPADSLGGSRRRGGQRVRMEEGQSSSWVWTSSASTRRTGIRGTCPQGDPHAFRR
jgi:IMP dehydrogenase